MISAPSHLLRALAASFRRTSVRRIVAVFVLVGMSAFWGESLIADICVEHPAVEYSSVDPAQQLHMDEALAYEAPSDSHGTVPSGPMNDGHHAHACHCNHAHTSDLPAIARTDFVASLPTSTFPPFPQRPLSVTLEPQLRPPLA